MQTLLSLQRVHKSYSRGSIFSRGERIDVLKGVDLSLPEGGSVGLIGLSGSGKSTLSRVALGIERPDSGTVSYLGRDIRTGGRGCFADFRRNVQVVFQNVPASVNPRMTAARIIAEPLSNFESLTDKETRERVLELLSDVGLKATDAEKRPHEFSGGELQRVCIARAIAARPRLIVYDEAVSSLDMIVQAQILSLIERLRASLGTASLFISHDLRVVRSVCDDIAMLHEGRIVERLPAGRPLSAWSHPAAVDIAKAAARNLRPSWAGA
jgi:nickel transport system ATP-binding protein